MGNTLRVTSRSRSGKSRESGLIAVCYSNSSDILCNLPRRDYSSLIDRDENLTELLRYVSPNYRQHITIVEGIGGVGKTALVLEAAYLCCEAKGGKPLTSRP
jgi:hypothetical protein